MRSDEEIRKSIFDDIVEILKHTIPKDSNVDPEAIASAVSTYLQNTHMASQIGDQWMVGSSIYIATDITDSETTWTKVATE